MESWGDYLLLVEEHRGSYQLDIEGMGLRKIDEGEIDPRVTDVLKNKYRYQYAIFNQDISVSLDVNKTWDDK